MRNINQKELDTVTKLPAPKRYEYFIKKCVGWGEVWGLYDEGWALAGEKEEVCFPLWPASDYAKLCADKSWSAYQPHSIDLDELLEKYLPDFEKNSMQVAVFMTPGDQAVVVSAQEFINHLNHELDKY